MKLLFDQNLSPRLVDRLADLYPHAAHVDILGLGEADDYRTQKATFRKCRHS